MLHYRIVRWIVLTPRSALYRSAILDASHCCSVPYRCCNLAVPWLRYLPRSVATALLALYCSGLPYRLCLLYALTLPPYQRIGLQLLPLPCCMRGLQVLAAPCGYDVYLLPHFVTPHLAVYHDSYFPSVVTLFWRYCL